MIWQIYIILNIIPLVITCQHQLVLKNGCSRIAKVKEILSKNPESKIRNDSFLPLLMQELKAIMKFPGNEFREARISSHNSELNFGTPFCRLWITPKCYTVSHLEGKKICKELLNKDAISISGNSQTTSHWVWEHLQEKHSIIFTLLSSSYTYMWRYIC